MKIKFIMNFPSSTGDIKKDEEFEVILKKEPDKFVNYVRYQIRVNLNVVVNVPEMFVEEIIEGSH